MSTIQKLKVLDRSLHLAQVEEQDGNTFWIPTAQLTLSEDGLTACRGNKKPRKVSNTLARMRERQAQKEAKRAETPKPVSYLNEEGDEQHEPQ